MAESFGFGFWELDEPPESPRLQEESQESTDASPLLEILGNSTIPEPSTRLPSEQQMVNICMLSNAIFNLGQDITPENIWELWESGAGLPDISGAFRPGRPSQNQIRDYMQTQDYFIRMKEMGIELDENDSGLSAQQIGLVTILVAPDGKSIKQKLREAGIPYSLYQNWLKSKTFNAYYRRVADTVLRDAIAPATAKLAEAMSNGDLNATKLGFEITGHWDPSKQKQLDALNIVQIVLAVLEEEIPDTDHLRRIGTKISLRAGLMNQNTIQGEIANG